MKRNVLCIAIFSLLIAAAQAQPALEVVSTFSFPGSDVTYPSGIDNHGNVVGFIGSNGSGALSGFIRHPDGTFAPLVQSPGKRIVQTIITGTNNRHVLIGDLKDGSLKSQGFFFTHKTFERFRIPHADSTFLTGLNDARDFAGYAEGNGPRQGFISINGVLTMFNNPGIGTDFRTAAMNNSGKLVGNYEDFAGTHGFLRDLAGNFTTIDAPDATDTYLLGLNNHEEMVGYFPSLRKFSGFYFKAPDTFIRFNFPGKGYTVLTGINDHGMICGEYYDHRAKIYRALIARVCPGK